MYKGTPKGRLKTKWYKKKEVCFMKISMKTKRITAAMLAAIRAEQKRTKVEDKTILGMRAIKAKKIEDMTVEEFKVVMHKFELTRTPGQEEADE